MGRAALYTTYQHLKADFEHRRDQLRNAGQIRDPREEQIDRLQARVGQLADRVADRDRQIADLKAFRSEAMSRLAAQHEEILCLRENVLQSGQLRRLPSAQ